MSCLNRWVRALSVSLIVALASACSEQAAEPEQAPRPVKIFTVGDPASNQIREFPARLKSPEEAELSFRIGGQLQNLIVREGQRITQGELVAELDDTDYRLRLNDAQSSYNLTRSQLERMKQLVDRKMVSQAEVDERQAQFNQAEAALELSRQQLAYTRLSAPFDGLVARTHVERYQVVQANQPIITLYAGGSMDVVFQVPENLLSSLRRDMKLIEYHPRVRMENLPDLDLDARYKEHASQPDPKTLTYQVTLSVQPPEGLILLPGMSAKVIIDFAKLRHSAPVAVTVPVEAVFSPDTGDADQRRVWIVSEGEEGLQVNARDVKVGELTRNGIEILEGLQPGEQIVAIGSAELSEGRRVRAWERERGL